MLWEQRILPETPSLRGKRLDFFETFSREKKLTLDCPWNIPSFSYDIGEYFVSRKNSPKTQIVKASCGTKFVVL